MADEVPPEGNREVPPEGNREPPPAGDREPEGGPSWRVDAEESLARLRRPGGREGGRMVYVNEHGHRRTLPADLDSLTPEEKRAARDALSSALGAPDPDYARVAAVERLAELRAAGRVSEEDYQRERRRLTGGG